ncbi:MAG: alpha/beta hydrolase [Parvularculaceae bacterium]
MTSLRARLVNRYIRSTLKPVFANSSLSPQQIRKTVDSRKLPFTPKGVAVEQISAPVKGEWQRPAAVTPGRTIYYLHGGGFVFGSPASHRHLTFSLAKTARAPVFSLDYRLAPEHPCPAAIDDAYAGWCWLLEYGAAPEEIFVGGDSAGGGLALALMQRLAERKMAMPGGVFVYSPWTDLTVSGASLDTNERTDFMFTAEAIRRTAAHYVGALAPDDPRPSPLFGSFRDFPPTLTFASNDEVLLDDSLRLKDAMVRDGVAVELRRADGLVHVWPLFCAFMPEGARTVAETAKFIRA